LENQRNGRLKHEKQIQNKNIVFSSEQMALKFHEIFQSL